MTFSIVAYDDATGDTGVSVASRFIAIGSVVPHARAGIGAVATQARANEYFGTRGLDLLSQGFSPQQVLEGLLQDDREREKRQVAVVDRRGHVATFTGKECIEWKGHLQGKSFSAQGNSLAGPSVLEAMSKSFEEQEGELVDKLMASLEAGEAAGGDRRGKQSAAVLVVRKKGGFLGLSDKYVDLRVDDHPNPIGELRRIFQLYDSMRLHRLGSTELFLIPQRDIKEIQQALAKLSFYRRKVDGFANAQLERAVRKYRKSKGLMDIAYVDKQLIDVLKKDVKVGASD